MELAARLERRNEVGHVAHDEQLARHGIEDGFRIDAAVAARDQHDVGVLAVGRQFLVVIGVGREDAMLEAAVAVGKSVWEKSHGAVC